MTYPLAKFSPGHWLAADAAERDAIGSREGLRVANFCTTEDDGTRSQCASVDGLDASTWTATDTLDSVTDRGATTTNSITVDDLDVSGDATIDGTLLLGLEFTQEGGTPGNGDTVVAQLQTGTTNNDDTLIWGVELDDNTAMLVELNIEGLETDGSQRAGYKKVALFYRNGGAAVMQGGETNLFEEESDVGWNAFLSPLANFAAGFVNGNIGDNVTWKGTVRFTVIS